MENEYNKRFKNKEMSNDNFDVEGLWDNIADELNTTPPIASFFTWKKLGGGLFLLLALAVIGFVIVDSTNDALIEKNTSLVEKNTSLTEVKTIENTKETTDISSNLSINAVIDGENTLTLADEKNSIPTSTQDFAINDKKAIFKSESQKLNSDSKNDYSTQNPNNRNLENRQSNTLEQNNSKFENEKNRDFPTKLSTQKEVNKAIKTSIPTEKIIKNTETAETIKKDPKGNSSSPKTVEAGSEGNKDKPVALLSTYINKLNSFTPIIEDSLLYVGIREIPTKRVNEDTDNKRKMSIEGGIHGGVNNTFVKFNSTSDATYSDARNSIESSVLGSSHGAQIGILYKGWRVNTGAEFHNIWTKLDTKININTSTVFVPQALTLVLIDSTGNTLRREFQDTTVNASTMRTIAHYNNFQMWSIPLEIGRYRAGKKWAYGFSAGTSFNFLTKQTGKILDANNQPANFTQDNDNVLFQSFSMSIRANVMLGYKLRENVMVTLRPKWAWTRSNLFNNTQQADIHQVNLTLGLRTIF
jgi:hypothetical protein